MYAEPIRHKGVPVEVTTEGHVCDEIVLKLPVESCGSDPQSLIEVAVSRGDGKVAKAFITIERTNIGVRFRLIVKKDEAHKETKVSATATFFTPVFRS